jgi:phosphatidylinositol alpha-mannosyltransferase
MTTNVAEVRRIARKAGTPIRILLIVAAAGLVVWKVDLNALRAALHPESWAFVFAAIAANTASVIFKGWAWKGVVDGLPAVRSRTRVRDLVSPLFVGFLFNTVLAARLGEIVKVLLARRRLAVRGETVGNTMLLGSVVVENLVSTMAWVAVVVAVGLFLPLSQTIWITTLVIGFICLTIIGVALLRSPGRHMPPWLSTGPLWHRATRAFARLWGAVRESHIGLRNPRQLAAITLPSVASWGAQLVGIYCALRAFGLEVVGWSGAGLLLVTVTVAQIFPILPGNVGVFQAAVVVPITHSYPVSSASALAFAVGLQATEIVVGVVIGFLFLMVEGVSFRQLRMEAEAETEGHHTDVSMADTLAGP